MRRNEGLTFNRWHAISDSIPSISIKLKTKLGLWISRTISYSFYLGANIDSIFVWSLGCPLLKSNYAIHRTILSIFVFFILFGPLIFDHHAFLPLRLKKAYLRKASWLILTIVMKIIVMPPFMGNFKVSSLVLMAHWSHEWFFKNSIKG
jgi:hypothetical protein